MYHDVLDDLLANESIADDVDSPREQTSAGWALELDHIIKRQGTLPRGPKTRSDWLDKPDARLPLTDVISSISPSAIMITAIHTIFFIHHFSPLLILSCPLLIQKGFLSLTCCIGTNSNKAFFFCGYHIYRFTD